MTFAPGQEIGVYRIVRLLGQGGMGAVYEVEHTQLGVHYALKTFTFEGGHGKLLKNKFLAEGKVLARLRHPHLVRVFDLNFDEATGTPYFVMDLVLSEGGSPRTLADVKTDELDEERILRWFVELAAALDYIHSQGIVHRDVKLGNVLLSADGQVVLSDFGVSRLFSERLRSDVNAVQTMISEVGTAPRFVMGTQGYMAPEVRQGEEATPAADAYSLGVLFVHLLTGIWYEPDSKVFRLLETLDYRWIDVLPQLLAEDPAERPANLTEITESLRLSEGADCSRGACRSATGDKGRHPSSLAERATPLRSRGLQHVGFAVVAVAFVAIAIAVFVIFTRRSAYAPAPADFDETFGVRGIYESPKP